MITEKPKRQERKRTSQLSGLQIMFAAILAIGLILGLNFTRLFSAGQPLQQTYNQLTNDITQLEKDQADLIHERDYVQSDDYVESWARDEGKMLLPGEHLVIPVGSQSAAESTPEAVPQTAVQTTPPEPPKWQLWWSLFFDNAPPQF
jgi:cell division protein FtsB